MYNFFKESEMKLEIIARFNIGDVITLKTARTKMEIIKDIDYERRMYEVNSKNSTERRFIDFKIAHSQFTFVVAKRLEKLEKNKEQLLVDKKNKTLMKLVFCNNKTGAFLTFDKIKKFVFTICSTDEFGDYTEYTLFNADGEQVSLENPIKLKE